jgi:hypothetical protein
MHRSTLAVLGAALLAATTQVAAAGASSAPAAAAAQDRGLAVTPSILETTARAGAAGSVTITNSTGRTLRMKVRARPWRQSRNGTVAAHRGRTLGGVRVSSTRFTLATGASRAVSVSLRRVPSRRSQYGALEVVGRPTKRRRGINVVYRLVSSLRFNPAAGARRLRLSAGSARVAGRGRSRTLVLAVRNRGNTVEPVGGTVSISGGGSGRTGRIASKPILPGKTVNLRLASLSGLRRGAYAAAVTLTQGGRNITSVTRRFRIR